MLPPIFFTFFARPLSAVYQHFSNERSKFRNKVAAKDSQDCDSIIPFHFCLLFANYLGMDRKKRLLKFDPELSAR